MELEQGENVIGAQNQPGTPVQDPVTQSEPQTPSVEQSAPENSPPPPKKKFPKAILVVGAVFLVLVLLMVLIKVFSGPSNRTKRDEILWWGINYDETAVNSLIEKYQGENPNVKISYVKQSPLDYRERLTNALAKGEGPDIFEIHNTWPVMFTDYLDVIPSSIISDAEYSTTFYPVVSNDMSSGSGFVGIPLFYDSITMYINEEIFQRENKTIPVTWEDVGKVSLEMTKRDENEVITQSGIALGRTENVDFWEEILALLFLQNGAKLSDPSDVPAEGAINFFIDFAEDDEGVWDTTMADSVSAFSAGKLAMLIAPGGVSDEIRVANSALNFRSVNLPQIAKASPDQPNVAYANYWAESVWSKSKKKDEAWRFLKFVSEKDNLVSLHSMNANVIGVYSRVDMKELQISDQYLGSVVKLAPDAQSWYLVSNTFDGTTGINSQIRSAYKTAIDSLNQGMVMKKVKETLLPSLEEILVKFLSN